MFEKKSFLTENVRRKKRVHRPGTIAEGWGSRRRIVKGWNGDGKGHVAAGIIPRARTLFL